ncbi:MAG: hypothetical protein K1X88_01195 [Nannocystaceae bacterium]|nr:hypothetical protein [Nannocystaceae bacterium]
MHKTLAMLLALAAAGCGGDDGSGTGEAGSADGSTGGSGSTTATTTASTSASTTASTSASTTASTTEASSSSSTASTTVGTDSTSDTATDSTGNAGNCGALTCSASEYCDWIANSCGAAEFDEPTCTPVPDGCPGVDEDPVCGCDGVVYTGECAAALLGVDVDAAGGCEAPQGLQPCGYKFCDPATSYCNWSVSDVLPSPDGYACVPLPGSCGDVADCACLAGEPCADFGCEALPGGLLQVTCPGG